MRNITPKELRFSASLVAQGKLDEEERMVISSQLNQAAYKIEQLEKPTPNDSDIEAWARKTPTCKINEVWTLEIDIRYREGLADGAKAYRDNEIKHIK